MDEFLFTCLGLLFVLFLLATAVVGWIAWARVRRLERQLGALRARVERLASVPAGTVAPLAVTPVAPQRPKSGAEAAAQLAHARPAEMPPGTLPVPEAPATESPRPEAAPVAPVHTPRPLRPAREAVRIDWERWLGVRGFAVVGGVLFALAAILLFQHAFANNWIPPSGRVALGIGAGLGGILWAARLRKKDFGWAPSALEGAGVVALYASLWAAQQRYALVGPGIAFPGMALVTVLAGWLALKHGSLFSALLGLAGGFATPLLLAEGHERPVPLFGYVLLLDLGLLFVARKRRWTALALLGLACTQLLLGGWIFVRDGAAWPGLGFALAFAAVFALADLQPSRAARGLALATQALGLLAPFAFAVHYASALDLGRHFGWTAAYLALLVVLATLVARRPDAGWLAGAAVVASVAVAGTWFVGLAPVERGASDLELVGVALGLAGLAHLLGEWEGRRAARQEARAAALVAALAWCALLFFAEVLPSQPAFGFWPLVAGIAALAALLLRQAVQLGRTELALAPGIVLGLTLARLAARRPEYDPYGPPDRLVLAALPLLAGALLFHVPRLAPSLARRAPQAAGVLALAFTGGTLVYGEPRLADPHAWLPGLLAFGLAALTLAVATRLASSAWIVAAAAVAWFLGEHAFPHSSHGDWEHSVLATLASLWLVPAGLTLVGAARRSAQSDRPWAWAALALLPWLLLPMSTWTLAAYHERGLIGLSSETWPYLLLAIPQAGGACMLARRSAARGSRAWLAASASALVCLGLADALGSSPPDLAGQVPSSDEWAVGLALCAAAWSVLGRRLGLEGPRHAAAVSALFALTLALGRVLVGTTYPNQGPFSPRIAYEHLVPAAALLGALLCLPPTDGGSWQRARRVVLGSGVLVLVFLWLNWTIESIFTTTERVALFAAKGHARDLTTSLTWGVYGMVLLLLGTARHVTSLRWASLVVLLLSIGKVFLHDLGHLDGLFRVASLAGLALSLIAVSLFYQRFVFGKVGPRASANPPSSPS